MSMIFFEDLQIKELSENKEVYNSRQDHQPIFLDQNIEPSIKVKKSMENESFKKSNKADSNCENCLIKSFFLL